MSPQINHELPVNNKGCEDALLFMLEQPDLQFQDSDVVNALRKAIHLYEAPQSEWLGVTSPLFMKSKLLSLSKSDPKLSKPDTIKLDSNLVVENSDLAFISDAVVARNNEIFNNQQFEGPKIQAPEFNSEISIISMPKTTSKA